jgi:heat shock protein HslJ
MSRLKLLVTLIGLAALLAACAPIPPAATPQAAATVPATTSAAQAATGTVQLDTQGLPYSWNATAAGATPYDASQPPGPVGLPAHTAVTFGVAEPQDRQPGDPIMRIVPITEYEALWEAAGNPYVSMMITSIYSWTVALQSPPPTAGLPALPPEDITGVNDLAVQIGRPASDAESAAKNGVRFVGRWAQDANPVTAESSLYYTFQGFTNDGRNLVTFFYPVTTPKLPKQAELSPAEMDKFNSDPQAYIEAQAETLNGLAATDFEPDLTTLDKLVGSLQIVGTPATGLTGVVWEWLGTSWYELSGGVYTLKTNPVADPTLYQVVYNTDGTLSVKADCNNAAGEYTSEGGVTGSVRVEMGPTTLAMCAEGSRSQELINSLMAAQDFRVQPGGAELQLNMPAGGPVLVFRNSGPAAE